MRVFTKLSATRDGVASTIDKDTFGDLAKLGQPSSRRSRRRFLIWSVLAFGAAPLFRKTSVAQPAPTFPEDLVLEYKALEYDITIVYNLFENIKKAYEEKDPKRLAHDCLFPVLIYDDNKHDTAENEDQFFKFQDVIFGERIRSAVLNQGFGDLLVSSEGIMFGDGELWIVTRSEKYGIGVVNTVPLPKR